MPVLPLVGSMMRVPLFKRPDFSASSIMARPMRSLTLAKGLKNSNFNRTVAPPAGTMRFSLTRGVLKVVSTMLAKVFCSAIGSGSFRARG